MTFESGGDDLFLKRPALCQDQCEQLEADEIPEI